MNNKATSKFIIERYRTGTWEPICLPAFHTQKEAEDHKRWLYNTQADLRGLRFFEPLRVVAEKPAILNRAEGEKP